MTVSTRLNNVQMWYNLKLCCKRVLFYSLRLIFMPGNYAEKYRIDDQVMSQVDL